MKKIFNINYLLNIFFIFIYLNYLFFLYRIIQRTNPWIVADWLINYENGLIRRGLFGEIFFWFSEKLNFEILNALFILISILVFIFYYLSLKIIKQANINLIYLLVILSPATFLFNFYDPLTVGRKEILFLTFFAFYIYKIQNEFSFSEKYHFLIFFVIGIFLVLTHELIVFYMFFPLFIKFLVIKEKKYFYINSKSELFFIFGCLIGLSIIIFSPTAFDPNTPKIICEKIITFNVNENICRGVNGAIYYTFLDKSMGHLIISHTFDQIINNNYYNYIFYLLIFIFSILLIFSFVNLPKNKSNFFYLTIFNFFQILILCILFVIVNDWGRYLNIYFIINSLILLKFFCFNQKKLKFFNGIIILFLIVLNLTLWHMPHCCNKNFGNGFLSLKERIEIRIKSSNGYEDKSREFLIKVLSKFDTK